RFSCCPAAAASICAGARPDSRGAPARARMPVVPFAPRPHHLWVSPAVMADDNAQMVNPVFYYYFDVFGSRETEYIDQYFAANAVDFIANERVQRPGAAFDKDAKTDLLLDGEFVSDSGKSLF